VLAALVVGSLLAPSVLESEIRAVAALPGEPRIVSAAGVTHDEAPILTIENPGAFHAASTKRRLVLVGGAAEGSAEAVVAAVRWFKTTAPRSLKQRWTVSALPAASVEPADTQSLPRWIAFQAPDLVVTVGRDPLQAPTGTPQEVPHESIGAVNTVETLQKVMMERRGRSPLHATLIARVERQPLAIARVLARRYPETPAISYIPALAWAQTLRLAAITNDRSLREKVWRETRPWIAGEKPLFGDRVQLTAVAGTLIFADLATGSDGLLHARGEPVEPRADSAAGRAMYETSSDRAAARALADQGVLLAAAEKAPAMPEYGQGWTDDMFMATSVLAPSGARAGHERDLDLAARLLIEYASRLQQASGLFHHAANGPAAWGRGNGFAALGLMETLTRMRPSHPARASVLAIYRRQMAAALAHQAPDGMWRQIIDAPGSYREESATAMLLSAMARGVRLGWLDRSYLPAIRRAWRALSAHITDEGAVIDVCASTGAGPTRRYYLDRPAVTGADDRGGAMPLLAALEVHQLGNMWKSARH
jgi:unsaturated rhamnogalacturonyl hydrolase